MSSRRLRLWLVGALALACVPALAQPVERDHRGGHDHRTPPPPPAPPAAAGPTEAPPPPQAENPGAKAGFEWIAGRWDWKGGKWDWVAGHWERPRAGKHWRQGTWQHKDSGWAYVDGDWVAGDTATAQGGVTTTVTGTVGATVSGGVTATPPPAPPPVPAPEVRDHRQWKLDRPVISSYWPNKGKAGSRIVIRGHNFPTDAQVMWGTTQITAAKVTPDQIMFQVPPGAVSGEITLKHGHGRDLPVGSFEIVATGDPEAEARKAAEEARKQAEAEWAARQKELAKDRAAREAAWQKRQQELDSTRDQRRQQREAEIRAKWQATFLADADTQSELTLHAQRLAQLQRAKDLAELKTDGKLAVRIDVAVTRENTRHDQRMAALETAFRTKGGAP